MLQAVAQSSSFLFCTSWSSQGLFTLKMGDFLFSIPTSKRCGDFPVFHIAPSSSLEELESSYPQKMLISKTFSHDHAKKNKLPCYFLHSQSPAKVCSQCYVCNLLTVHIEPNTELIQIWCDTVEIRGTLQLTQAVNLAYYPQMNWLSLPLLNWEQILHCIFFFFAEKEQLILIILVYHCDLVIWKWES